MYFAVLLIISCLSLRRHVRPGYFRAYIRSIKGNELLIFWHAQFGLETTGLLPSQTILNMTSVLKSHVELLEQRSMRFSQFSYLAWAKKKKKKHWYLFKHPTNCCFIIHDSKYRQNYFTSNNHRSFKKKWKGVFTRFPSYFVMSLFYIW